MSKKIIMGLAPLLAVAAFAVMPAMASAATYGICETGEPQETPPCAEGEKKFTALTTTVKVVDQKTLGSGNFILKAASGAVIECEGVISTGTMKNTAGVGESAETLSFHHCFTVFEGKKCRLNTAGAGAGSIVGTVTDKVITETTVKVTVTSGFALAFSGSPPAGCPAAGTVIGTITGSVTGTQAKGSNVLVFTKAKGIKLGTEETEVTGSVETYTEGTDKPVVIGPGNGVINWIVNGTFLKAGEEVKARTTGGPIVFTFAGGVIIKCKSSIDKDKLIGPGKDEITAIKFENCKKIKPLPEEAATIEPINLPWASRLGRLPNGKIVDTFSPTVKYKIGAVEGTIKGELVGEWNNSTSEVVFPETPLEGSTLKTSEGEDVVVSGGDKVELEEAGTLEVGEE